MIITNPTYDEAVVNRIMERLKWTVTDEKVRMRIRIEAELERTYYKDLRAKDELIKQNDEILKQQQQELVNLRLQAAELARQQAEMAEMREQMALRMQQLSKK